MSNLKQIGLAINIYAGQYERRVPWTGDGKSFSGIASCQPSFGLLSNELTSAKVFSCPSTTNRPASGYPLTNVNSVSYCLVPVLIWKDTPDSILAFDRIGSVGKMDRYWRGSTWTVASPHGTAGGNILFNDGHVSWQTALPSTPGTNGQAFALRP
jgi:prepilin-type processing-associated H-X9-DG protein